MRMVAFARSRPAQASACEHSEREVKSVRMVLPDVVATDRMALVNGMRSSAASLENTSALWYDPAARRRVRVVEVQLNSRRG
jgi:hypothetical protein